jgi:hypothetical protein
MNTFSLTRPDFEHLQIILGGLAPLRYSVVGRRKKMNNGGTKSSLALMAKQTVMFRPLCSFNTSLF